ncbi:MAG: hypothetical protein JXB23_17100, partial [Candidatus Aminicenantes bacterium]|nr:hypothetical protein [Candidatus Aminicenantes bacterium]
MVKDNNFKKESASIIEEIESQLQDVLDKRKKEVEQNLEEKIRQEQEEAKKKISELETQLKGDKEALISYKNVLSDFESNKERIKNDIKSHLDKAILLQTEIEQKTGLSLQELRTVNDLNKKLEEINQEAASKVNALKSELEDKYGIVAKVPAVSVGDEVHFDLDTELKKLQQIKVLLSASSFEEGVPEETEPEEKPEYQEAAAEEASGIKEDYGKEEGQEAQPSKAEAEHIQAEEPEEKPESQEAPVEEDAEKEDNSGETGDEDTAQAPVEETPQDAAETPSEFVLSPDLEEYQEDKAVREA